MPPYFRKSKVSREREAPKDARHWGALCDKCPLRGASPVYGDGPVAASIAIVGESPGHGEVDAGVPFIGKAGQYLEEKLAPHGLSRRDVLLENAVACFPPGGDLKTFVAQAKKSHKAEVKEQGEAFAGTFLDPVTCCRPRLMYALGVPRCATCMRWDVDGSDAVRCSCQRPKWVKSKWPRVKSVLAAGNAALESLRGEGGVKAKMNYVFKGQR